MRKYELTVNEQQITVYLKELTAEAAEVEVNGETYHITIDSIHQDQDDVSGPNQRSLTGAHPTVSSPTPQAPPTVAAGGDSGSVCAPIPGSILSVYVKNGDEVQAGQPLYKMEAMKMENEINSRVSGTVAAVHVGPGDNVAQGQELLLIEVHPPQRRQSDR